MNKNTLSRRECQQEALREAKGAVLVRSAWLAIAAILLTPIIVACFGVLAPLWGLSIPLIVLSFVLLCLYIWHLSKSISTLVLVSRGEFSIMKDIVSRKVAGEAERYRRTAVNALYFSVYGRYVCKRTYFDLASEGDEFYVVVLNNKKKKIVACYPTALYACTDCGRDLKV